jgi:hypothetical protein
MEPLTLIHSVGRDAPESLDAILGVPLGALMVLVLWWRGTRAGAA